MTQRSVILLLPVIIAFSDEMGATFFVKLTQITEGIIFVASFFVCAIKYQQVGKFFKAPNLGNPMFLCDIKNNAVEYKVS